MHEQLGLREIRVTLNLGPEETVAGKGTGLGISVVSRLGEGATFLLHLPLAHATPVRSEP